ncbi:MAG: DNA repair protein RecO [Desulfobacterales bacterium]|nr:DNA repair protein RecO [Desulfobacterales bacterium]MCP4160076.1 DNA repair protein RecO [Deltaproteobacteria bacterium]
MSSLVTPAILIRRLDFGDHDLISTFMTQNFGKITAIGKNAKKSVKRFGGSLELFTESNIVITKGKRKDILFLQEAYLEKPNTNIRKSISKTAYASYFSEIVNLWMEENFKQASVFRLLSHSLCGLDTKTIPAEISIFFQVQFLKLAGISPELTKCRCTELEDIETPQFTFSLNKGSIICKNCSDKISGIPLSKGTVKLFRWIEECDPDKVDRIKFSNKALKEGLLFLEQFLPYHLGKNPRSLDFLRNLRRS